jgi:hypothetical protein
MDINEIDPDELEEFQLPDGILSQLFEFTGCSDGDSGFVLAYVSPKGAPAIITKTCSPIVEMGLRKALEQYLEQMSSQEMNIVDNGEEDNP